VARLMCGYRGGSARRNQAERESAVWLTCDSHERGLAGSSDPCLGAITREAECRASQVLITDEARNVPPHL